MIEKSLTLDPPPELARGSHHAHLESRIVRRPNQGKVMKPEITALGYQKDDPVFPFSLFRYGKNLLSLTYHSFLLSCGNM